MRHIWKRRKNPRGRPQRRHRLRYRMAYLCFFLIAAIQACVAIVGPSPA